MKIARRRAARIALFAIPALLGIGVLIQTTTLAQQNAPAPAADNSVVFDYAGQITRLVQNGNIDELSHLNIPSSPQTSTLRGWTSEYLGEIQLQEKQRDKQYTDAVTQAQNQLKANHFDKAMEHLVLAYRIAKDPEEFKKIDWVKDATAKVAARAADLEKKGQWLESLQLYTDLNTLYEIDTFYKADMQRLARRVLLLVEYTPRILYDMRIALDAQERDEEPGANTQPATKPAEPDSSSFTNWKDLTERITVDMGRRAIDNSVENWVHETTYETLVKGGIDSLRLFLTTPELAKEFPGLGDDAASKQFAAALDGALANSAGHQLGSDDVQQILNGLIEVSDKSVKLPKEVIIKEFTDGAMEKLDPFTAVIWPHEVPDFEKNMNGKFGGVGIQISIEAGQLKVVSPLEDTPAYKAGIEAGDLITEIDGKSTVGITVDKAVSSITGIPGTSVVLKVKRGDKLEKEFTLRRDIIKVASVKGFQRDAKDPTHWDFMLDQQNKIGYIRVTGFQEDTADELEAALQTLKDQGMRGLVLDFRFNPGGLLQAAVDMSDMFLQNGVIVSTRGRTIRARPQRWEAHPATEIPPSMPMVVLVNEYSASASEIFSGAMKDLHRALIVGHRTFGKGSVQNLLPLTEDHRAGSDWPDGMMKLTMALYYLPNGESLHRNDGAKTWGVEPDVIVDLTPDQLADLLKNRRDNDIIHAADEAPGAAPASAPATTTEAPAPDTQLETALLMMRLQLVQSHT